MIRNLKSLIGFAVQGRDGEIGALEDFYLDDDRWVVRYLEVESGEWLNGRRLLFSTRALGGLEFQGQRIDIPVDLAAVRDSPEIEPGMPFGRQHEVDLHNYYQWPLYWSPGGATGLGPGSLAAYPLVELAEEMAERRRLENLPEVDLARFETFVGRRLHARDGSIGSVQDLLIEDEDWRILYLVVDTGGWLTGRHVLVSPSWVQAAGDDGALQIDLSRETIQNSPEYDPAQPLGPEYEERLYRHYGKERRP